MNTGQTYIDINYDAAWIDNALRGLNGFLWLFEWGMYLLLIATLAIMFWVFYDSMNKNKDAQALVPRILTIVGFFLVIPAFIFRFTGNADGVSVVLRLSTLNGVVNYPNAVNWNVNWLVNGFGPMIAIIALAGLLVSIVGLIVYTSAIEKARPGATIFGQMMGRMVQIEDEVRNINNPAGSSQVNPSQVAQQVPTGGQPQTGRSSLGQMVNAVNPAAGAQPSAPATPVVQPVQQVQQPVQPVQVQQPAQPVQQAPVQQPVQQVQPAQQQVQQPVQPVQPAPAANRPPTIIDHKPSAATIIDTPPTGDTLLVQAGPQQGMLIQLPAKNVIVGRDDACDVVLSDGKVSSTHVNLIYANGAWQVEDANSTNGTWLNNQRLSGQVTLMDNDQIKIGDTLIVFGSARAQAQHFSQGQYSQNPYV